MKIVVNRCYGGFGLSPLAKKRYLELIGKECYFYGHIGFENSQLILQKVNPKIDPLQGLYVFTKDYGEIVLSGKIDWSNDYINYKDIARNDENLVAIVEQLSSEVASGRYAELEVVEIPDDVDWEIDEYDGKERVAEKHRTW